MYLKEWKEKHTQKSNKSNPRMNNAFVLVFVIYALSIDIGICFAQSSKYVRPFTSMTVTIFNQETDDNLIVHCKSKDDDLG